MRHLRHLLLLSAAAVMPLTAQEPNATLSGTVLDASGAVVSGATVDVISDAQGTVRHASSGRDGSFTVFPLQPGSYHLLVKGSSFAESRLNAIVLRVGDKVALQVRLAPAGTSASVEVQASAPLVREDGAVSTVIGRQLVENLPLNGRSFQTLVELAPGVVLTPTNVTQGGQFSVNGQRPNANNFVIDGVSANFGINGSATLYETAAGTLPAYSALGGTNNLVSTDALQEFQMQTSSYSAEGGRQPGAQVSIVTRSGTNSLHGNVFDYLRNDYFDANNFFAKRNGLRRPALRQNDFGATLGGPVYLPHLYDGRNRTFFFVSYEGLRLKQPNVTSPIAVPSVAARNAARGNAFASAVLNAFPLPTGATITSTDPGMAGFVGTYTTPSTLNATSFRLDQHFGDRWNVFGRFNYSTSNSDQRALFAPPNSINRIPNLTRTLTFGVTTLIRPTLVNEFRLNQSRDELGATQMLDGYGGASVPTLSTFVFGSADPTASGSITIGAQPTYINLGLNAANVQRQWNIVDSISLQKGSHSLKAGFDWRRLTPIQYGSAYRQLVTFSNVAAVQNNIVTSGNIIAANVNALYPVFDDYSAYLQDTWRASQRLTLTYGVRYEVNPAPTEANGNQPRTITGDVNNPSTLALAPANTSLYSTRYNDFAPRVGVSYKLTPDGGTTLRAGWGLFYDLGQAFIGSAFSTTNFPFARIISVSNTPITSTALTNPNTTVSLAAPYGRLFAYSRDYNLPYSHEYNLTLDQLLSRADRFSVAYVGSTGRRLGRIASLRTAVLNPSFTRIDYDNNDGRSNYNALQLQFEHRLSHGLQALVSYSWSKSLDIVSDETIVNLQASSTRLDINRDYGPSSFDVRHQFSGSLSYNIPTPIHNAFGRAITEGWGLDLFGVLRSAAPVNILTNTDPFGLGLTTVSRPNLVAGQPLYLYGATTAIPGGRRFNKAAFSTPAAGQQGTLGRNLLRGFGSGQLDLSARRNFRFYREANAQLRLDAFNVMNRANFADPTGVLTDTNFGVATQMQNSGLGSAGISSGFNPLYQRGGPRSLQLSLKLNF